MTRILGFHKPRRAQTFETLVRPHLERLHRLAYRFTGSVPDAEDLVQSLLLKLYPQTEKLSDLDKPAPWLARALYNLFVDQVRRRTHSPLDLTESNHADKTLDRVVDDWSELPEETVERLLVQDRLLDALARLPAEQRALIAWHDIEGYTLDELAETHGTPLGTLKSRLHRARARLRQILMEPFAAPVRVKE